MVRNQYFLLLSMIFKVIFGSEIHIVKSTDKPRFHQLLSFLPTVFKALPSKFKLSYHDEEGDEITFEDQSDYDVLLATKQKSVKITIKEINEDFIEMTNEIHIDQFHQDMIEQEVSEIKHPQKKSVNESQDIDTSLIEEKIKMMMPEIISKIKTEINEELREKSKTQIKKEPVNQMPNFKKQDKKVEIKNEAVIHKGITCDGCNFRNIEGVRYKCSVCNDFDFCQKCEATVEHPHPFLKIKTLKQTPLKIFTIINQEDNPSADAGSQRPSASQSLEQIVNNGFNVVKGLFGGEYNEQFINKYNAAKEEWKKHSQEWKKCWNNPTKCEEKREQAPSKKTEKKPAEVKKEQQKKAEVKPEKKEQKPVKPVSFDVIKRNANYLVEVFGFSYEKCLRWANDYSYMNKEELLNYCLSQPNFYS